MRIAKLIVRQGRDQKWYGSLRAPNNRIYLDRGQGFKRWSNVVKAIGLYLNLQNVKIDVRLPKTKGKTP